MTKFIAMEMHQATPTGVRQSVRAERQSWAERDELEAFGDGHLEAEQRHRHSTAFVRSERRQQRGTQRPARQGFSREVFQHGG